MVTRRLRLGKRDAPSRANGTLLTTGGAGAMAWGRAFEEQYGVPASIDDYAGAGMPDREVGRVTFLTTAATSNSRAGSSPESSASAGMAATHPIAAS